MPRRPRSELAPVPVRDRGHDYHVSILSRLSVTMCSYGVAVSLKLGLLEAGVTDRPKEHIRKGSLVGLSNTNGSHDCLAKDLEACVGYLRIVRDGLRAIYVWSMKDF